MIAIHSISPTSKALSAGKSALAARPRRHPGPAGPAQIPHRASHRPTRPARTHPLTSPRRPATPRTRSRMRVNHLQALGSRSRSMPPYRADHLFRCGCEGQKTNRRGRAERAVLLAGETAVGDPDDLGQGPVAHLVIDLADQRLSEVFPGASICSGPGSLPWSRRADYDLRQIVAGVLGLAVGAATPPSAFSAAASSPASRRPS